MLLMHVIIHYQLVSSYSDGEIYMKTMFIVNQITLIDLFSMYEIRVNTSQPPKVDDMVD